MDQEGQEQMVGQMVGRVETEVVEAAASEGPELEVEGMEGASGDRGLQY